MEQFAIKIRTDINAVSTLYVTLVCSYKSTAEDSPCELEPERFMRFMLSI